MVDPDKKDVLKPIKDAMRGVTWKEFQIPLILLVFGFMLGAFFAYTHGTFLCNSAVEEVLEEYQCFAPVSVVESSSEVFSSGVPKECYYYCENCESHEYYDDVRE